MLIVVSLSYLTTNILHLNSYYGIPHYTSRRLDRRKRHCRTTQYYKICRIFNFLKFEETSRRKQTFGSYVPPTSPLRSTALRTIPCSSAFEEAAACGFRLSRCSGLEWITELNEWMISSIPEVPGTFQKRLHDLANFEFSLNLGRICRFLKIFAKFRQNFINISWRMAKFNEKMRNFWEIAEFLDELKLNFWDMRGAKICKSCRSRKKFKKLQYASFLAIVAVHTAENESLKLWMWFIHFIHSTPQLLFNIHFPIVFSSTSIAKYNLRFLHPSTSLRDLPGVVIEFSIPFKYFFWGNLIQPVLTLFLKMFTRF